MMNVTDLRKYRKPMKNPILVELLDHWEALRAGRIAPRRSEIDPRQIENALQHAFILERSDAGEARFRIAGMQLFELMGMEVRSMPASSIISPECRADFCAILENPFVAPEIVELTLTAEGGLGLKAEMLLLPMKNEQGEISRILGCVVASGVQAGQFANPPHRFRIVSHKATRIIAADYAHVPDKPKVKVGGFSEPRDTFTPQRILNPSPNPSRTVQRPYLKLVESED
jgi:hypothetical protein